MHNEDPHMQANEAFWIWDSSQGNLRGNSTPVKLMESRQNYRQAIQGSTVGEVGETVPPISARFKLMVAYV